ncbi:MAG: hypothetical protein PHH49_04915 [Candidatus Omnitrophica bacterium]|nr:hypothetical protein [Candidatus Omnitrophota bacterium]MDD5488286.1 hypothetical protein [Candidatus Omnitrophota bacterium]
MPNSIFNKIVHLAEYAKDLKALKKRFRTLDDDIETFIKVALKLKHKKGKEVNGIERISNLGIEYPEIYKVKRFACKALKGRGAKSGIRIIYAYFKEEDKIEFIEVYFKGDKGNEDRERIKKYYGKE